MFINCIMFLYFLIQRHPEVFRSSYAAVIFNQPWTFYPFIVTLNITAKYSDKRVVLPGNLKAFQGLSLNPYLCERKALKLETPYKNWRTTEKRCFSFNRVQIFIYGVTIAT